MGDSKDVKKLKEGMKKLLEQEKLDKAKMAEMQAALETMSPDPYKDVNKNYEEFKKKYQPQPQPQPPIPVECGAGQHWDEALGKCVENTVPVPEPHPEASKDVNGITKIYADKAGGVFVNSDKFTEEEFTRNYQSGKPSENSYENEYKSDQKLDNIEVTYYVKINGFKSQADTISIKTKGPDHQDGSGKAWYINQIMTDGGNEDNFQIESPHPENHDNHQPTTFTIGESLVGKWIGVKAISYLIDGGTDASIETWVDFPVADIATPPNKWRKYIDVPSAKALEAGFIKPTGGNVLLRIDGTKKGDMPNVKYQSLREILPEGNVPTVPPVTPPTEPPVPPTTPPVTPPPTTTGLLYDSNTIGKWNTKPRTVTGLDPECPKVFTGQGGLEMHASGDPTLVIDGKGYAELQCKPGHGRFYVDVCNYNSALEYEVNFLDGSVENNTLNLRSRHQEGEPPANRMGGVQAKLDLKNYDFKTEIFHNEHENSSGDKPLPKPLSLNTWYKVKYTVKDVGSDLYQGMELDYNDGKGYVKVGEQTIKSPNKVYMEKDKILGRSYFWIRMNNSKNAKLGLRNVKLTAQ